MRLVDSYGFSLHTIKENKSRSILTISISAFLSLLVMGLMCIVISFIQNANSVLNKVYFENAIVSIDYDNQQGYSEKEQHDVLNSTYYSTLENILKENEEVVSFVAYKSNSYNSPTFTDPRYPVSTGIEIIEGRNILPSTKEAYREVIISQSVYSNSLSTSDPYTIGSIYSFPINYDYISKEGIRKNKEASINLRVVGVFAATEGEYLVNGSKQTTVGDVGDYLADANALFDINDEYIYIQTARIYFKSSVSNLDPAAMNKKLNRLTNQMNEQLPKYAYLSSNRAGFTTLVKRDATKYSAGSTFESLNMYKYIFLGVGAFISIVLLLMSVGSLANSVNISIDSSKKFLGLLKALGVRGRGIRRIVTMESATLITIGLLVALGLLYALSTPLSSIVTALTSSMYGSYMKLTGHVCKFNIPIYVLFIAIFLFVSLTLLFARGSLRKIAKTDPIAVISEVS